MSFNILRCRINEIKYIKDAFCYVKSEENECFFNKEAIKNFLCNDDNWFYIAIMDDRVVAYAIAYIQKRLDTTKNMICLYEISTLKCCRKRGIAKRIINKIIEDRKLIDVMNI